MQLTTAAPLIKFKFKQIEDVRINCEMTDILSTVTTFKFMLIIDPVKSSIADGHEK